MKMLKILTLSWFCLALVSCSFDNNLVLAQLGEQKITWGEFREVYERAKNNYDPFMLRSGKGLDIKNQILNQYIDQKLLLNLAQSLKIQIDEQKILEHLEILQGGTSNKDFKKMLQERNLSFKEWRNEQKNKLIISKLINSEIRSKINITDLMIQDYYQANKNKYKVPAQVRALHIMVKSRKKAEALLELLKKGEDFAKMAQQHSESPDAIKGGDLGYFPKGQYPRTFDKACFSLNLDEISDIVVSQYGFHLFKLVEKIPPRTLSWQEVKDKIKNVLLINAEKGHLDQWLKQLRQENPVMIRLENLKKI